MISRLLIELQMLTGIVTDDIDYLMYVLLKDGSYFSDEVRYESSIVETIECVPDIDDWFSKLEEV